MKHTRPAAPRHGESCHAGRAQKSRPASAEVSQYRTSVDRIVDVEPAPSRLNSPRLDARQAFRQRPAAAGIAPDCAAASGSCPAPCRRTGASRGKAHPTVAGGARAGRCHPGVAGSAGECRLWEQRTDQPPGFRMSGSLVGEQRRVQEEQVPCPEHVPGLRQGGREGRPQECHGPDPASRRRELAERLHRPPDPVDLLLLRLGRPLQPVGRGHRRRVPRQVPGGEPDRQLVQCAKAHSHRAHVRRKLQLHHHHELQVPHVDGVDHAVDEWVVDHAPLEDQHHRAVDRTRQRPQLPRCPEAGALRGRPVGRAGGWPWRDAMRPPTSR